MTQVYAQEFDHRYMLAAIGHATGSDTVCAAVSALIYAFAGYLDNDQQAKVIYRHMTDGNIYFDCTGGDRLQAAFEMAVIGLQQVAEAEPEYLNVTFMAK